MINVLTTLAAFILGFALSRASTCTVAATRRLVSLRKVDWLLGIGTAIAWSALALFGMNLLFPDTIAVPQAFTVNATAVVAALIMGVGAWLNNGCFIGSIGHISSGNLSFLATFAGLATSQFLGDIPGLSQLVAMEPTTRLSVQSGMPFWAFVTAFVVLVGWSLWRIIKRRQQAIIALATMGFAAAIVYSLQPSWSYEALIGRLVHGENVLDNFMIVLTVAALFSGAIISATLNDRFKLRSMGGKGTAMCFLGGVFMGIGAQLLPGGNDTLILWVIPGFAVHALVAYVLMIVTVAVLLSIPRIQTM